MTPRRLPGIAPNVAPTSCAHALEAGGGEDASALDLRARVAPHCRHVGGPSAVTVEHCTARALRALRARATKNGERMSRGVAGPKSGIPSKGCHGIGLHKAVPRWQPRILRHADNRPRGGRTSPDRRSSGTELSPCSRRERVGCKPVSKRGPSQGALRAGYCRLGEPNIQTLPLQRTPGLRQHEEGRLYVRG